MNYHFYKTTAALGVATLALSLILVGCGGGDDDVYDDEVTRTALGESAVFGSGTMQTWVRYNANNFPLEAGATIPMSIVDTMPAGGDGPTGAIAALKFPDDMRTRSFFKTLVVHSNPQGHPGAYYLTPHYDFHFYNADVQRIRTFMPPDAASQDSGVVLPPGYVMEPFAVPEMGTHAITHEDHELLESTQKFEKTMIQGYYDGRVEFVEPMLTQKLLQAKQPFTLPVPRPATFKLGAPTLYPTKFRAEFDASSNSWQLIFSDFQSVQ